MKELTVVEMNDVSGAGVKQLLAGTQDIGVAIVDATLGSIIALAAVSSLGGLQGGVTGQSKGGGLLGVGFISTAVGSIWGAIQGAVYGAIIGLYNGADYAQNLSNDILNSMINGTGGGYKI